MTQVAIYDTTLRDGAQYEGISLSVEDKLAIAAKLDQLGVQYIEGGWPGSNPTDAEFFERAKGLKMENATLAAFGSTRRAGIEAKDDANLLALLEAETPVVTLVGKPFLEIVKYAKEHNSDLIVMATHGRGAMAHILMGGTAEKVVRKAPCPVLTVKHPKQIFSMPY